MLIIFLCVCGHAMVDPVAGTNAILFHFLDSNSEGLSLSFSSTVSPPLRKHPPKCEEDLSV